MTNPDAQPSDPPVLPLVSPPQQQVTPEFLKAQIAHFRALREQSIANANMQGGAMDALQGVLDLMIAPNGVTTVSAEELGKAKADYEDQLSVTDIT